MDSCDIGVTHRQVSAAHHDVPLQQLSRLQHKVELVRLSRRDVAGKQTRWIQWTEVQTSVTLAGRYGEQHLLNWRRADGLQTLVDSQKKAASCKVREAHGRSRLCFTSVSETQVLCCTSTKNEAHCPFFIFRAVPV